MPRKRKQRYGDYCEIIDGSFYGSVQIPIGGGKYKRRRKKVESRTAARQWALAELDRHRHGSADTGDLQTFIDLAEWYKKYFLVAPVYERGMKVEGSKDWLKSRNKLDRMCAYFGPKRLTSFSESDLRAYTRHRRSSVTTATINRDLALMRTMFKKGYGANPSIRVPVFPINTAAEVERDRVMSFDEEKRILAACEASEPLEYIRKGKAITAQHRTNREHLRAIIIIAVDTAMRSGEILSLEWKDVDFDAGVITLRPEATKTQKGRKIGMTSRVAAELKSLAATGRVFSITSARKAFATACRRAKVTGLHFHDLRHTAITRMVRAGIPHTEIMKVTGHSQIRTFLRYLNLTNTTVQSAANQLENFIINQ